MNGELAQVVALVAHGNAALAGIGDVDALEESNSTFQYVRSLWEAAFLAGKAFIEYRRKGGTRTSTLPEFFIGAHAAVDGLKLVTRDGARYRTYFPTVELVTPDS